MFIWKGKFPQSPGCHGYCRKSGKRKPSQVRKISCTVYHCASSGGLFFTYDEKDPWNQMPSWLSELLLNMSKIENLQEGYERMCELAPCSPSHLCRLMKQISGKTPTQYINQERLKYAVYLLAQTDREILDICECCGFSNVSHFYHLFREQFGVSPAKFRKTV